MDETAIYCSDNSQTAVTFKVNYFAYILSNGYKSCRMTCILSFRLRSEKLLPVIIKKSPKDTIMEKNSIYLIESIKTWSTQEVIKID